MKSPKTFLTLTNTQKSLSFMVVLCCFTTLSNGTPAEKKKTYTKPPFTTFASQMDDALTGKSKYEKPVWNLHDALNLPKWLALTVDQRTRYETMDGSFRAASRGGDQQIALQTDVWLQATLGAFRVGTEFLDARAVGADSGSGVNNTHANEADFLQYYLAWSDPNVAETGIGTEVTVGRQTLNIGSRRLVARNNFRNTINSFTGARLRLLSADKWQFNAFATMPVNRYPASANDILNETHVFDKEDSNTWFSGGFLELYDLGFGINSEVYLYHLSEADSHLNPTRNRRYFTPGMRFYKKAAKASFDFQTETIGQFGTVRATTAANDGKELSHEAWYQHIDGGYTLDAPWSPRLAFEYDYASGDENPTDGNDQRFDTLYGARRFDYGPTGIYGAFARSNISSPGARINLAPTKDVQAIISYRSFWLAQAKDSWTTAGLRDTTGRSGDFVGQQVDLSTRWDVNSSLNLETGWTHLFKGEFAKRAPSHPNTEDVDYFYVSSMLRF